MHWNEDIGEWQLKCVAYTGNNMRKQTPAPEKEKDKVRGYYFGVVFFLHFNICMSVSILID